MNHPLLSICIATYNRADYIGETLNSIIPQLDDDIELLVVDGASTDNTQTIVESFAKNDSRIRYIRLATKGGIDQDYDKAVELAQGEYCWLFTDDDLLKPGAIDAVKELLPKGHYLIIVNAEVHNKDLSKLLDSRRIDIKKDRTYSPDNLDSFFIDAVNYISFIGAVVIRRSIWLGRNRKSYFGTEFVHVGVIFQRTTNGTIYVIGNPYIIIRYGNAKWTSRGFDIWMFKWPQLIWSFNSVSLEAKKRSVTREPWRNFKNLVIYRESGSYDLSSYEKYFGKAKIIFFWKLFAWIIAIFPVKIMLYILSPLHWLNSLRKNILM